MMEYTMIVETQKIIGNNLRLLRASYGLSQTDMANIIGNCRSTYTHYELGHHAQDIEMLFIICNYFDISIATLFEPNDDKFIYMVAKGFNHQLKNNNIIEIYNKLSPSGKESLVEQAALLLQQESSPQNSDISQKG